LHASKRRIVQQDKPKKLLVGLDQGFRQFLSLFYLPHMEYEGYWFSDEKNEKKNIADFYVLGLFMTKNMISAKKKNLYVTHQGRCRCHRSQKFVPHLLPPLYEL
jgi:hypothetical protein